MIDVSKFAQEQVNAYFKDNGKAPQPVRIFIHSGCGGAQLSMALDKIKPKDSVFSFGGVDYIMDTAILEQAAPVKVDFTGTGFSISSSLELGSGCSGSCSSGSCGA